MKTTIPLSKTPRSGVPVTIPADVAERAHSRWLPGEGGCHLSTYAVGSHGYAQLGWTRDGGRGMVTAHRAAWTHVNGQIPLGQTVDHLCHVRVCVNPDHLRLLPNPENASDNGQVRVNQPVGRVCEKGHQMVAADGGRPYCRSCQNERRRNRRRSGRRN